jgi:hypothetical protein
MLSLCRFTVGNGTTDAGDAGDGDADLQERGQLHARVSAGTDDVGGVVEDGFERRSAGMEAPKVMTNHTPAAGGSSLLRRLLR